MDPDDERDGFARLLREIHIEHPALSSTGNILDIALHRDPLGEPRLRRAGILRK